MDWKNILERAAWTFLEGFLGALVLKPDGFDKVALLAAVMAGISAVKTLLVDLARSRSIDKD